MKRKLTAYERFYGYKMKTRDQFVMFAPSFNDAEAKISVASLFKTKNMISDTPENFEFWYCFSIDIYSGKVVVETKDKKPYKLFDVQDLVDEFNSLPEDITNA